MAALIAKEPSQPSEIDTTCPYCGVGCGVKVKLDSEQQVIDVKGRREHPANGGKLCVKGSSLHETVSQQNRQLSPQINGADCDWDSALDHVSQQWRQIIDEHGPDSVAFYLSGQLLTEDYYVANKLMKGFIGSANIDTNSRLCMASAVVAHKRAFGNDTVPGCYEDLEQSDVLFLVGSNTAYAHPIVFQRIAKAKKERNFKIVVLDPRRTATCEIADLHIPLRPGSDAHFFNGLLSYLAANKRLNHDYIKHYCDGFDSALAAAQAQVPNIEAASTFCDIDADILQQAYALFAENERVVTLFSQGINQSSSGVDKGNAIINCHLATGKIGLPGCAPFSITGQPNAMGGREVGGLANQLAAHMDFNEQDIDRVQRFWQAPNIAQTPGLKAVDMFDAVHDGKIKAIWIMATNPAVTMPDANKVKAALEKCDLVVVSDCTANTDTAKLANVVLPATTWGEKYGTTTNSERCISRQPSFIQGPKLARNDWEVLCDFANRMGYGEHFNYKHPVEIFREHAALSGFENNGTRAFNIAGLSKISKEQYDNFSPKRWPITTEGSEGTLRLFTDGRFFTDNQRAKFIPIAARFPSLKPTQGQFIMNTGRIRDQWHTMTRTGKASRLLTHIDEPYVQMHPQDAQSLSIKPSQLVELENRGARFLGRVKITDDQRLGELFVPMHWNDNFSAFGRADALVNAITDPLCGQPEFKHSPVVAKPYAAAWQGYLLSVTPALPQCDYWTKTPITCGYRYTLADTQQLSQPTQWLQAMYPHIDDWIDLSDSHSGFVRIAGFIDQTLQVALIIDSQFEKLPDSYWLTSQLNQRFEGSERFTLLSASAGDDSLAPGAMVCSCFQVGENHIQQAIDAGCKSAEDLGKSLKCGTNCGSCIPELDALIAKSDSNSNTSGE